MPVSKRARRRAQRFVVAARSKVKGEEVELEEVEVSGTVQSEEVAATRSGPLERY